MTDDPFANVPLFSDQRYENLTVGQRFGPFGETLVAATSDRLRGGLDTSSPGAEAPLGVLPLLTLRALRHALQGIVAGGVLIRQTFSVVSRIPAEGEFEVAVTLTAQQRRPSGFYSTFAFSVAHEDEVVAIVEWMILAPPEEGSET